MMRESMRLTIMSEHESFRSVKTLSLLRLTYLSATVVEKARKMSCTLFAFLSYKYSSSTSTISILHSLIFQLVAEDKNLQNVLYSTFQSNRSDLKSGTKFAQETFLTLLKCA